MRCFVLTIGELPDEMFAWAGHRRKAFTRSAGEKVLAPGDVRSVSGTSPVSGEEAMKSAVRFWITVCGLVLFLAHGCGLAQAETNHLGGGVFIAHYVSELTYTELPEVEVACADYVGHSINTAGDQINRIDGTVEGTLAAWFVLSAWAEDKEFCGVQFGFGDYDSDQFAMAEYGVCAPGEPQELPGSGWPGPNTGTAVVATDSSWVGNYVPVYYFGGYAYDGATVIPLAENPSQAVPFGGWTNCDDPLPFEWEATAFGGMGINTDGIWVAPEAVELHACCVGTSCLMRTEDECAALEGVFLPEINSCDPNPCPPSGATYVVRPDGTGDFPTIQAAIDSVQNGDIIELTDGAFTGDGNRNVDYLGKAVTVRSQSGDPDSCIINCQYQGRGFIFQSGEDSTSVLEGVTVTNGYLIVDGYGGGIYCVGASPTIRSCTIRGNVAGLYGGGIYFVTSSPLLESCIISDNHVLGYHGGGIYFRDSPADLVGCVVGGNSADHDGGGIYMENSPARLTGCVFAENTTAYDGGGVYFEDSVADLVNCVFVGNSADCDGGGIYMEGSPSVISFVGCVVADNTAGDGGGGIYSTAVGAVTITWCDFSDNIAGNGGGGISGGAVTITWCDFSDNWAMNYGGGVCLGENSSIGYSTFVGNIAEHNEGGAALIYGSCTINGCSFIYNDAQDYGGGIYFYGGSPTLSNCTLYGNSTSYEYRGVVHCVDSNPIFANTIIAFSVTAQAVTCSGSSTPALTCCDIYGNDGGDWTGCIAEQYGLGGNISEDPWFCDPENRDLTLHEDSPCAPFSEPNPECDLIGALPVGCAPMAVPNTLPGQVTLLLGASTPNPFTQLTRVSYSVPSADNTPVRLAVLDVAGRVVRVLADGRLAHGLHSVFWDGADDAGAQVAGGLYFYRLSVGGEMVSKRVMLIR